MPPLTPSSAAALKRLSTYTPPPPTKWSTLPLTRRAAVLILLYADARGELRVVLTMRSTSLRSYAGQAALPGGKADTLTETPVQVARREAWEEIGLPLSPEEDDDFNRRDRGKRKVGFAVRHLAQLPTHLARTALGVRPCVAFLEPDSADGAGGGSEVDTAAALIPRLDAKEVAEVFSAPLHDFLKTHPKSPAPTEHETDDQAEKQQWYEGRWIHWHDTHFRMHSFHVPRTQENQILSKPLRSRSSSPENSTATQKNATETERIDGDGYDSQQTHYTVFGMTARILVDCARVAYGVKPDFEHSEEMGDEGLIGRLMEKGSLDEILDLGRRSSTGNRSETQGTVKKRNEGRL